LNERQVERIPFEVDVSRIIDVLAKQIYQTPLALLRENAQNAFDAILLRRYQSGDFEARIEVRITDSEISISDNGIGMSPDDLRTHFWRAGSSGKNTPDARAAGVVGTFGIGAMANFGIADKLTIETESALTGERTLSSAERESLSTTEDCIELGPLPPTGQPGTTVTARMAAGSVNVAEAETYIADFVAFVDLPVVVNERVLSRRSFIDELPPPPESDENQVGRLQTLLSGDVAVHVSGSGEAWVLVSALEYQGVPMRGAIVLRQGQNALRTFRSGFGLAVAGVSSVYNFGGLADATVLQPTAGREALTTESLQVLQELVSAVDEAVSLTLAGRVEADLSTAFMQWVRAHGRFDLCAKLKARLEPGPRAISLEDVREQSAGAPVLIYTGSDRSMIEAVASDEAPLLVVAASSPRRQCELQYLRTYCATEELTDTPTVLEEKRSAEWSRAEQAVVFRIVSIVQTDYFLTVDVGLGRPSHGLPLVALTDVEPIRLVLDPQAQSFSVMARLYETDFHMFGGVVKDYVRNIVFPRIADFVPSSTRQGAEAFLKSIGRRRDVFEYEADDLEGFSGIWEEFLAGGITMQEAAERSIYVVRQNVQVIEPEATRSVAEVVPDVAENQPSATEAPMEGPAPPIVRTDVDTAAKLLTVQEGESPIYGYRCFIALSDRAREERGEFFLQPHSTAVVWGGQKVLFIFEHHSGEFGIYYDLQASHVVSDESGGGPSPTATLVLRDKIFIPIPDALAETFIPSEGERKRFEVRWDLLYTERRPSEPEAHGPA
jgi:molecular chaperone HtpG